jgi:predicted ATPase
MKLSLNSLILFLITQALLTTSMASDYQTKSPYIEIMDKQPQTKLVLSSTENKTLQQVIVPVDSTDTVIGPLHQVMCPFACITQGFVGVAELFGAYYKNLEPGFNCLLPWATAYRTVNIKPTMRNINKLPVITKDNQQIEVTGSFTFQVSAQNADKAIYNSNDQEASLKQFIVNSLVHNMQTKTEDEATRDTWKTQLKERVMKDCTNYTGSGIEILDVTISRIGKKEDLILAEQKKLVTKIKTDEALYALNAKEEIEKKTLKLELEKKSLDEINKQETEIKIRQLKMEDQILKEKQDYELNQILQKKNALTEETKARTQNTIKLMQMESKLEEEKKQCEFNSKIQLAKAEEEKLKIKSQLEQKELQLQAQLKEEKLKSETLLKQAELKSAALLKEEETKIKISEMQTKQREQELNLQKLELEKYNNQGFLTLELAKINQEASKAKYENQKHAAGATYIYIKDEDEIKRSNKESPTSLDRALKSLLQSVITSESNKEQETKSEI